VLGRPDVDHLPGRGRATCGDVEVGHDSGLPAGRVGSDDPVTGGARDRFPFDLHLAGTEDFDVAEAFVAVAREAVGTARHALAAELAVSGLLGMVDLAAALPEATDQDQVAARDDLLGALIAWALSDASPADVDVRLRVGSELCSFLGVSAQGCFPDWHEVDEFGDWQLDPEFPAVVRHLRCACSCVVRGVLQQRLGPGVTAGIQA